MLLLLMRHGHAVPAHTGSDAARVLSTEGMWEVDQVASALLRAGITVDGAVSSPFVRAVQTAKRVLTIIGERADLSQSDAIVPATDIAEVRAMIAHKKDLDTLLLVGHMPGMGELAGEIAQCAPLEFATASVAGIDINPFVRPPLIRGALRFFLSPEIL